MSPCGPGHYIGYAEGEMLQSKVDHALQGHSKASTPRKDCETCRLQGQYEGIEEPPRAEPDTPSGRVLAALSAVCDISEWKIDEPEGQMRMMESAGPEPASFFMGVVAGVMFGHWWPVEANKFFYAMGGDKLTEDESSSFLIAGILSGEVKVDELAPTEDDDGSV